MVVLQGHRLRRLRVRILVAAVGPVAAGVLDDRGARTSRRAASFGLVPRCRARRRSGNRRLFCGPKIASVAGVTRRAQRAVSPRRRISQATWPVPLVPISRGSELAELGGRTRGRAEYSGISVE